MVWHRAKTLLAMIATTGPATFDQKQRIRSLYATLSTNLPEGLPADGQIMAKTLCGYARSAMQNEGYMDPFERADLSLFTAIAAQQHVALQRTMQQEKGASWRKWALTAFESGASAAHRFVAKAKLPPPMKEAQSIHDEMQQQHLDWSKHWEHIPTDYQCEDESAEKRSVGTPIG